MNSALGSNSKMKENNFGFNLNDVAEISVVRPDCVFPALYSKVYAL